MTIRVAINGFGRMGKLAFRAGWDKEHFKIVHINEIKGDAVCHAHLLEFDSVHGRWQGCEINAIDNAILVNGRKITFTSNESLEDVNWKKKAVDLVIDCTGKHKNKAQLMPYFDQDIEKILVSAPCPEPALNLVYGINHKRYDHEKHHIVTAASCTTNCLAPVVSVMHKKIGIKHGSMTTLHNITNTQIIADKGHKDLRRARSAAMSLIPTTTGSAKAISLIFPELKGKLDGHAVRVPLLNASITDFVFEAERPTSVEEVNKYFYKASEKRLRGILGYEERPLVSSDYVNDKRSSIVDAQSTLVTNNTQVKVLAWYDNEWGYVQRLADIADMMSHQMLRAREHKPKR